MRPNLSAELDERFRFGISEANEVIAQHPWLMIPDLNLNWLRKGYQGVYHNISVTNKLSADFCMHFHLAGRLYIQLIRLASPSEEIFFDGGPSPEMQAGVDWLNEVEQKTSIDDALIQRPFTSPHVSYGFRLIIGRSENFSAEERWYLEEQRTRTRRIRSYSWLVEKATRFTNEEIEQLDRYGPAQSEEEFYTSIPRLERLLEGPMPPHI